MTRAKTTRQGQGNHGEATPLYLAFELGRAHWKLGFTTGMGQRPRQRTISAGVLDAGEAEIERAGRRFGLPADVQVISCYEAGRDGFWLHRFLVLLCHLGPCSCPGEAVDHLSKELFKHGSPKSGDASSSHRGENPAPAGVRVGGPPVASPAVLPGSGGHNSAVASGRSGRA